MEWNIFIDDRSFELNSGTVAVAVRYSIYLNTMKHKLRRFRVAFVVNDESQVDLWAFDADHAIEIAAAAEFDGHILKVQSGRYSTFMSSTTRTDLNRSILLIFFPLLQMTENVKCWIEQARACQSDPSKAPVLPIVQVGESYFFVDIRMTAIRNIDTFDIVKFPSVNDLVRNLLSIAKLVI